MEGEFMKGTLSLFAVFVFALVSCSSPHHSAEISSEKLNRTPALQEPAWGKSEVFPRWAYDSGPEPTPVGRELININSNIPYFPGISESILGQQKFRPAFGPVPWRMLQKPNSVKILFIGQDATHIAEAAGRPATAAFGGRAQDLAKYFGVGPSAAFINAYAFTIQGQDGSNGVPILVTHGKDEVLQKSRVISNGLWLMSRDLNSPIVQWRNDLIEWIIRNNRDSLRMIVTFGKPAQDAAAAFVLSRLAKFPQENKGTSVGTKYSADDIARLRIQVPEYRDVALGGNSEGPVLLGAKDQDLFKDVLGRENRDFKYSAKDHPGAMGGFLAKFKNDPKSIKAKMVFSGKGLNGSGILNPAQIGGYDIRQMMVAPEFNGSQDFTINLKGLKISEDMGRIKNDILLVDLPHPTFMTRSQMDFEKQQKVTAAQQPADDAEDDDDDSHAPDHDEKATEQKFQVKSAAQLVAEGVEILKPFHQKGWTIEPDMGFDEKGKAFHNGFAKGEAYDYGRANMGPESYDFGAPASRMVNVSSAVRVDKNVIEFGGRDPKVFDIKAKTCPICLIVAGRMEAKPASKPSDKEMWTTRPRTEQTRFVYDPGPPAEMAQLMKEKLPLDLVKAHPMNQDYGHYRGTFTNPQVVILADQDGWDDLITARALTGTRGQYLQGLMDDLRVGQKYLVIKTAPFSTEEPDWEKIYAATMPYRSAVMEQVLALNPKLVLTDGPWAEKDIQRLMSEAKSKVPVISIRRQGAADSSGIADAAKAIQTAGIFPQMQLSQPHMADIPRAHLSYYARIWEGTSGDRVITALGNQAGKTFAEIAPLWATDQKFTAGNEGPGVQKLLGVLDKNCLRRGGEKVSAYLARKAKCGR